MILKVVIAVVTIIALLLLFAASKPNTIRVQRSITIHASPEKFFRYSTTSTIGIAGRPRTEKTQP